MPQEQLGLRITAHPDGRARRHAGVLGRPIAHSLSPTLHRAAYAALGLDWTYTPLDCGIAELGEVLAARRDWAGFSCTMPLKHAALEAASDVRLAAATVGAANTLLPGQDGWIAENTDVAGIRAALAERPPGPGAAVILGAGGTAQAALVAFCGAGGPGVAECTVLVRDVARTAAIRATAERLGTSVRVATLAEASGPLAAASIVVATLPGGAADAYADGWASAGLWRAGQSVLDVVYAGWPTPLARYAQAGGATVVSGAVMLLHQAAAQVEAMTGHPAPVAAMRTALRAAAPGSGA